MENKKPFIFLGIGFLSGAIMGSTVTAVLLNIKKRKLLESLFSNDIYDDYEKISDRAGEVADDVDEKFKRKPNNGEKRSEQNEKPFIFSKDTQNVKYTTYYKNKKEQELAENEYPFEEAHSELDEDTFDETVAEEMENIMKDSQKPPKIIPHDALEELDGSYEIKTLLYYQVNDVLADEDDHVIIDIPDQIGDALTKFGFKDNDENIIYVQNFKYHIVYEIQKINSPADWVTLSVLEEYEKGD